MSSSTKAATHRGAHYLANLKVYKNTNFEEIQSFIIQDHTEEILNVHNGHCLMIK